MNRRSGEHGLPPLPGLWLAGSGGAPWPVPPLLHSLETSASLSSLISKLGTVIIGSLMMCGKILCEWSDEIDGPVIWVFPVAAMGKVGGRTDQNWPKSGEHQVTRRREDPEAVRLRIL